MATAEGEHTVEREHTASGAEVSAVLRDPAAERLGRRAENPGQIPWPGWKAVIRRTAREAISDRVSLVSAGCAFWATLALFPAITMLIFIYGLVFDPATVEPQLQVIARFVPPSAYTLISDRVHQLVSQRQGTLGVGLLISTAVALWSSATGTKALLSALNLAYEEEEQRSFLRFQFVAFAMTLCAILGAVLAIAILVFLPAVISFVGLSAHSKLLLRLGGIAVLVIFVLLSLSVLYRFGPSRTHARWHWITPGSLLATLLWLAASVLFTLYVTDLANYDATYGPLGTVVGVMMWFWVTIYAVMLGAELNSELELQTARDSTEGPPKPMGKRGAFVADHVAED
ncbi:MAG: YihY/virulence factor BrkB family protein [Alphaproteobacteria bacterium]|nr:YihY/virulence factor BrkB family protein [Alphaproteobacteria bacterium]